MEETKRTFCRVCEPACGLVATVVDGRLARVEPDRDHPITRGFACNRGMATFDIHHDPDRLDHPLRGDRAGGLVRATWDEAIGDIARRLRDVVDRHGPQAVASYGGNPAGFNSLLGTGLPAVLRRLGATRYFNSGTQDCLNKYAASNAVFGSSYLHPIPDVEHADVVLLIGSNWRASKASFVSLPNAYGALVAAAKRGARVRFVNPRVTETSTELTGPTIQILPDTDVYFLAALVHEIDRTVGFDPCTARHGRHVDELRRFVAAYSPDRVAPVCGVAAATIRALAAEFATAERATVHMSTGVNMGRDGTLAYWLVHMLAFVTGNLGEEGGNVVSRGYYDIVRRGRSDYAAGFGTTEFGPVRHGELPGGLLADHVLDAADPVRALVVLAGNPLLSIPGEERLRRAFAALELLVVIDVYPTATAELADWALPATDMYERADLLVTGLAMQPRPWVQFTDAVVEPAHERREEWWILARIGQALGQPTPLDEPDPSEARWGRVDHMLRDAGVTRSDLGAQPHGLPLEPVVPGRFHEDTVQTPDGLVDCCPDAFAAAIARCAERFDEHAAAPPGSLRLIARRASRTHNTWFGNVLPRRPEEDAVGVHPDDALALGLPDGGRATMSTAWGSVETAVRHDASLRPGVVSAIHGAGEQRLLRRVAEHPGTNVNAVLPHGPGSYDDLSNQQWLTGVPVTLAPLPS